MQKKGEIVQNYLQRYCFNFVLKFKLEKLYFSDRLEVCSILWHRYTKKSSEI